MLDGYKNWRQKKRKFHTISDGKMIFQMTLIEDYYCRSPDEICGRVVFGFDFEIQRIKRRARIEPLKYEITGLKH